MKSRIHLIKRLLAIFGCVAGLVLLAVMIIWGVPYYRSKQEVIEAVSLYQEAGLPVSIDEIFHAHMPDHVTSVFEELGRIRDDRRVLELIKQGETCSDEVKYSVRWFYNKNSVWRERKWNRSEEKLVQIQRFCADHRTQKALSLIRKAARHDYRNGLNDYEFHGARLPEGQYNSDGRDYLEYLLADQSRIARDDPSKRRENFQTLLLMLKMEDLLVQGYTFSHYQERQEYCIGVFKDWMRFDRMYETPADLIDKISQCMEPQKEKGIWLNCHDRERIFGNGHSQRYYDDLIKMEQYSRKHQTWKSFLSVKLPYMLDKSFERIDFNLDRSFFLRQVLSTRGVSSQHFQAAMEVDQRFRDRQENGGPLFLPPYYENYIESYHEVMMWHEILKVGLAINCYADDHGALPKSLDDLVPSYLPSVPQDRFPINAPERLTYEVHDNLFNLRSSFKGISFSGRRTR